MATAANDICWYYNKPGGCWFGDNCRFRHIGEQSDKLDQPVCRNYSGPGTCPYEDRCRFQHVDTEPDHLSDTNNNAESVYTPRNNQIQFYEEDTVNPKTSDEKKSKYLTPSPVTKKMDKTSDLTKPSRDVMFYQESDASDDEDNEEDLDEDATADTDTNNNSVDIPVIPPKVTCGECGASFKTKTDTDGLAKHYMEKVMKMDKEHIKFLKTDDRFKHETSCGACGRIFLRSHSLLSHITDKARSKKGDWKCHEEFLDSILMGFTDRDYGLQTGEETMDWLLMHLVNDYTGDSDSDSDGPGNGLAGLLGLMVLGKHLQSQGVFDDDDDSDDNFGNPWGYDDDDIYELACQGIKPWDPEAGMALAVLNGDFDYDDNYTSYETSKKTQKKKDPEAEPYHPDMKAVGFYNIDAFIDQCKDWDEDNEEKFTLHTGEKITKKIQRKYFEKPDHYIEFAQTWCGNRLISKYSTKRNKNSSMSGSYKNFTAPDDCKQVLNRVRDFLWERRETAAVTPILDAIFADGYEFKSKRTDPNFRIYIYDLASFGDFKGAQDTVPGRMTVLPFYPGVYHVTIIKPHDDFEDLVIFHHSTVNPDKLVYQLIKMADSLQGHYYPEIPNYLDRGDWFQWRSWGCGVTSSDEEEEEEEEDNDEEEEEDNDIYNENRCKHPENQETGNGKMPFDGESGDQREDNFKTDDIRLDKRRNTVYFLDTDQVCHFKASVRKNLVKQSDNLQELFKILNKDEECIGFGVDLQFSILGDWIYGQLFEDKSSGQYFALVCNNYMSDLNDGIPQKVKDKFPDQKFTSVKETKLQFDMANFKTIMNW